MNNPSRSAKVVIYGRYSTGRSVNSAIQDQVRLSLDTACSRGWLPIGLFLDAPRQNSGAGVLTSGCDDQEGCE